ncbi:MAG: hypothetical protein OSA85_09585 [Psychrobacter pacificensis]|uniref:hypothetical protein n=1 Tax=Psychrobacter pacificensis TaxID=112002 RepID=UPI00239C38F6|nr:hypothetical protein [Psychrobacter pacificensis]MDE0844295.1 hypothetical protein [Psychrobacter pacificensis]
MSTKTISKIETRIVVGFDDETKSEINALKSKLDEVARGLSAKKESHADGLLAAMQAEAANDAPQDEIKQLGQWVFEGQPKGFITAHVNSLGQAAMSSMPIGDIKPSGDTWVVTEDAQIRVPTCLYRRLKGQFDATNWQNSAITRETVNDVDYLSGDLDECVPNIDDVLAQPNWLSESVPQITDADMQLIFIKNLSDVLIQRMHSMDRFSEDDYAVGGDELMPWDILFYESLDCYAVLIDGRQKPEISDLLFFWDTGAATDINWNTKSAAFKELRTITEAELPAFRAALEACYA